MRPSPERPCDNVSGLDAALLRGGWRYGGSPGATSGSGRARCVGRFALRFWGWRFIGLMADRGQHGEGEHHERDVTMPAVPRAGFVVIQPEFVFGSLEAVLDSPAVAFDPDQGFHACSGRAPGSEEGKIAVGDVAADEQTTRPRARACVVVLRRVEIGQLAIRPVVEPRSLGAISGRETLPCRSVETLRNRLGGAGDRRSTVP